jgi:hypothetical protein
MYPKYKKILINKQKTKDKNIKKKKKIKNLNEHDPLIQINSAKEKTNEILSIPQTQNSNNFNTEVQTNNFFVGNLGLNKKSNHGTMPSSSKHMKYFNFYFKRFYAFVLLEKIIFLRTLLVNWFITSEPN